MRLADAPDVLRAEEVASITRLGRNKVYALLREGRIRSVKVDRRVLIPKEAVAEFLGIGADDQSNVVPLPPTRSA